MEEKDIVAVNEMNDSRIRNTDEIHFDDRLYDGNIILRSSAPFCDAGQWRYKVALPIVIVILLWTLFSGNMMVVAVGVGITGYISWMVIKNRIAYKDVVRYNQKITFYLPYQMNIEELGDIVKKVLEPETKHIGITSDCVYVQYRDLTLSLYFDTQKESGMRVKVGWEPISEGISWFKIRYWLFDQIIGSWRSKYAAQAVSSISYIIYKIQQEVFRMDEGSRRYYTGTSGMYQRVKTSIFHILFNVIVGIAILFAFLTGEE